jgi:hypothetical protein
VKRTYIRELDGAIMIEIAPHRAVNLRAAFDRGLLAAGEYAAARKRHGQEVEP